MTSASITACADTCRWCGCIHLVGRCPAVKSFEYHPDGTLKRVEFFGPADYMPAMPTIAPMRPWWEEPFFGHPNTAISVFQA